MIQVVDQFIANGGDPTIRNKAGFTALHIAAREGYKDMVKLLINKGVDPNIRDSYGYSAAFWAK